MSWYSFSLQMLGLFLSILDFVASPTGGRDIGRAILRRIGLRGGTDSK